MTNTSDNLRNTLPSYQQTKIIHGAKILEIVEERDGYLLTLDTNELRGMITKREDTAHDKEWAASYEPGGKYYNEACHKIKVDFTWHSKHDPRVGGYFVLYPDGYQSYSPAEPFEAGNKLVQVQWNHRPTDAQVNHLFFQLRHNLNTIRWGHQPIDKVMEQLTSEPVRFAENQQVWVAGKSLVALLEKRGIATGRVPRRGGNPLFIDTEGLYVPHDILIRAELDGQMLVRHVASWVVIEE